MDDDKKVAQPPAKPLMIWDRDCNFCRRWIERWRESTQGKVEYVPYQQIGDRFPEVPTHRYERAVHLVETDGKVYRAAEAVFQGLRYSRRGGWLKRVYDSVPGFAPATELAYRFIAVNRPLASWVTRLLWGDDVRRPTYFTARSWFLRAVGIVYLIAFVSLWVQVEGLIGARGILPVGQFLEAAEIQAGDRAHFLLPTLLWLNSSNVFLHFLCAAGAFLSLLLIAGVTPILVLALLFVFYLSLVIGGQVFLSFQWDILLLETGFFAMFLAPTGWLLHRARRQPVSKAGLFMLKLVLFKLMLMSGVVKLTSGDPSWGDLTALNYHYWTQPLPTVLGWWAEQGPLWSKKFATGWVLFVELVAPLFIWAPRRLRLIALVLLVLLQITIALTGNYTFFNLLTVVLCLLLLDDGLIGRGQHRVAGRKNPRGGWWRLAGAVVAVIFLPLQLVLIWSGFYPKEPWPKWAAGYYRQVAPFHLVSGYGLFRVMTKTRPEIIIEGSSDGIDWRPYDFRWKPDELDEAPRWVAPHQPRLDWQMWFASQSPPGANVWALGLLERLLQNEPAVVGLLEGNPFPDSPPRYVRAILYRYEFSDLEERRRTGRWWKRIELREYVPTASLREEPRG